MRPDDSRPKILLTDALHPEAEAELRAVATVATLDPTLDTATAVKALYAEVQDAQGLIVRRQLPGDLFDQPNTLRGVVRHGVGLDFIPVDSATRHGLPVANTPEVNANAVAEYAITAMLEGARRFRHFDQQVREGNWGVRKTAGSSTFELKGRKLGIVGFGAIGKRIAQIAMGGFDMHVAAHTRSPSRLPGNIAALALEELFERCDFIVVACPLTEHTRGMLNSKVFAHAKTGLILINVGRGPVINEPDLVQALESGRIAGAALDVFTTQPLPMDSRLRAHPNVTLTPHLAGTTGDAELAMGMMAASTVLALIRGERPANIVNPECFANREPLSVTSTTPWRPCSSACRQPM
ncbi:D-3-phosphoglycerate dehydrogenase [Pusillimonas sp. T7-7]|uniref:hydroxyacid dehydrogenase n=1 Tax=Pusillimonas sp. (strain T7-7) TaxID=1007105 RepID=UPI000208570F|nr:hydroxyacid dehydrogenase [Pusillimonas sp. T7-7]AEC21995.1 D-3-phosphoglycerate dehydrogenase [Pusillimonas sp. T7-7]